MIILVEGEEELIRLRGYNELKWLISASLINKAGWICDCYFLKIYKNTAIPNLDAEQIVVSKIGQYIKA